MKSVQLVFVTWLNVMPLRPDRLSRRWISHRFHLWRRTALRSIKRQTNADWRYCLLCAPEGRTITSALGEQIADERVSIVHVGEDEVAWRAQLPEAQRYVVARLDSDDRYHPTAGANYLRVSPRATSYRPFLQYNKGYVYDTRSRKVYHWQQPSSPFYARVLGPHYRAMPDGKVFRNHVRVRKQALELGGGHFVVTIHDSNTSTGRRCRYIGEELPRHRARVVAKAFQLAV